MRNSRIFSVCAICLTFAFSVGCGGGSSRNTENTIVQSGNNVAPISVNGGPTGGYVDGAFASVTLCAPGTSTCQTITDLLVDTGSSGIRILSSALTIGLAQQNSSSGNPVVECLPFLDSYTWGPVQLADVQIAGEKATSVPVQVLSDTDFTAPSACTDFGPSANTLDALGANGLLGVGLFAQDCGAYCEQVQTGANFNLYYQCPAAGCEPIAESLAQQVQNPVALFASDNNGVVLELPAVSGGQPSVSGSLVFGIGTQSNNALGTATVYVPDSSGNFTTTYNGVAYPESFIDSGSNGYFFLDSSTTGILECGDALGFYCPASTVNISADNQGTNGSSGTVNFSVANADTLFANQADTAFGDLGGTAPDTFDWGLPFFFGRNVFVAIEGKSAAGATGPYWAY